MATVAMPTLQQGENKRAGEFVLWFEEAGIEDIPLVGGKNASLGEMIQHLQALRWIESRDGYKAIMKPNERRRRPVPCLQNSDHGTL